MTDSRYREYLLDDEERFSKFLDIGIYNPIYGFNDRITSHRSSWAYMLAAQMKYVGFNRTKVITDKNEDLSKYHALILDWGMEFKGVFNVFGGASDELAEQIQKFIDYKGILYSAHVEPPDISGFVNARRHTGTEKFKSLDIKGLEKHNVWMKWFSHIFYSEHIVFGDSHALSCYRPGYMMYRHDGQTLHGILKKGISNVVPPDAKHMVFYFGNIDVRHHLCRPDSIPLSELMDDMESQLCAWRGGKDPKKLTIVNLLPVEHEGRKLPKTGYYEGTPFYGYRERRAELVDYFNHRVEEMCRVHGFANQKWPEEWYQMDPEEYAEKIMERPRSVHIGRQGYLYDLETNEKNNWKEKVKQ